MFRTRNSEQNMKKKNSEPEQPEPDPEHQQKNIKINIKALVYWFIPFYLFFGWCSGSGSGCSGSENFFFWRFWIWIWFWTFFVFCRISSDDVIGTFVLASQVIVICWEDQWETSVKEIGFWLAGFNLKSMIDQLFVADDVNIPSLSVSSKKYVN